MEFPLTSPRVLRDPLDVAVLVQYLRSASRDRPVVAVTIAQGATTPYVTPESLTADGRADVVVLPADLTFTLTETVGKTASVFSGACRVYPAGTDWEEQPYTSRLFLARDTQEQNSLHSKLTAELTRVLAKARQTASAAPPSGKQPEHLMPHFPKPKPKGDSGVSSALVLPICTREDAQALARHLRSADRSQPMVVVSRAMGTIEAYADVESLGTDLQGIADVAEIETLDASWAFSEAMVAMTQVYGGAARAYPVGTDWESDPHISPLRFAYSPTDRAQVTRTLLADAMGMASRGGFSIAAEDAESAEVTGCVQGIAGGRVLVDTGEGFPSVAWPELVEAGLPAERIFAKGMPIEGIRDGKSRRIDVNAMRRRADQALAQYTPGDTILVRVVTVARHSATVEPFPGYHLEALEEDEDLTTLMTAGETIAVFFGGRDQDEWLLSVTDAEASDTAVPAPSILNGGPPWLVHTEPVTTPAQDPAAVPEQSDNETHFVPEATPGVVEGLARERDQLLTQLREAKLELTKRDDELIELRRQALEHARRRRGKTNPSVSDEDLFLEPADQLTFDIQCAWARQIGKTEKAAYPLAKWTYGPEFMDTLAPMQGISRDKLLEVLVQVLTGRDAEVPARQLHRLRSGSGGDDPFREREDNALCWRVSLQVKTASARRLHYWRLTDGTIELSSIRLHDDFRP